MAFKSEELIVWEKALEWTNAVDQLSGEFPKAELYILPGQIKRAADSMALNIAEGSNGQSDAEFMRFINYSIRSAIEVVGCLFTGGMRSIIKENSFK